MSEKISYINYFNDYSTIRKSLFLGGKVGLMENLRKEFPKIWSLYKQLKSLDWDENEIDISPCRNEFKSLPKEISDLMIKTLAWQFEADSSATHICNLMMPFVNNTETICYLGRLADNECLTPDHEVLTPNGWIPISQVSLSNKIAQWEYGSFNIKFVNPTDIVKLYHEGPVYNIFNTDNTFNQVVTGNHRLPLIYTNWTNSDEIKEFDYAENITLCENNGIPTSGYLYKGDRDITPKERLYIAVHAYGNICYESSNGSLVDLEYYKFDLNEKDKIDRLQYLCKLARWDIEEVTLDNKDMEGYRSFYVYPILNQYNSRAKTLDWFSLDEVTYDWCCGFIEELQIWCNKASKYVSNNKENIDKIATIAHLIGLTSSITTFKDLFYISFIDRNYAEGKDLSKLEIQYKGYVHCLTVPSSYFLVRRNNCISITGNCLHSSAYKVIVENSFDNPEEFIKELLSIEESFKRLDAVKKVFDETYEIGLRYSLGEIKDELLIRKTLFKFWVTLYALERIQFISSFAITFGLAEQNYFVPIAKLVQKICTDEFQIHVQADKVIIENELNIEDNFPAYLESIDDIYVILKEIVESELTWLDFLFGDKKEIARINKNKIKDFVLYSATEVYNFLSIENPFGNVKTNPLPYMNKWIVIDSNQSAPQEENVANYLLGGFIDDSNSIDLNKYNLNFESHF